VASEKHLRHRARTGLRLFENNNTQLKNRLHDENNEFLLSSSGELLFLSGSVASLSLPLDFLVFNFLRRGIAAAMSVV
jgi:hypothetical protein